MEKGGKGGGNEGRGGKSRYRGGAADFQRECVFLYLISEQKKGGGANRAVDPGALSRGAGALSAVVGGLVRPYATSVQKFGKLVQEHPGGSLVSG
eukprot:72823-Rhodomonas_salina.1